MKKRPEELNDQQLLYNKKPPPADKETKSSSPLKDRNFLWFLGGTTLTNAAQWIQGVTLSWLIYDWTSSGTLLGSVNLVRSIATVGLAPLAGIVIDRFSKKKLLTATSIWLFFISFLFAFIILFRPSGIGILFTFSFLGGIGQALSMPLRQTVVFSVVPRPQIPTAVALVQTGWAVMRSLGPALGGFLLVWVGASGNFFVQSLAYILVLLTLIKLEMPYEQQDSTEKGQKEGEKEEISSGFMEGWNYIRTHKYPMIFLLMSLLLPLCIIPNFNALPPIYAKDIFQGGPTSLGLLLSAIGIGGILGGFVVTSLKDFQNRGILMLGSLILLSLALIGNGLCTSLWTAMIFMGLAGFSEMLFITTNMTLLQLSIPGSIRGRVMGIISLRSGLTPLGALIAGFGSDMIGPRSMTFFFAGVIIVITVFIFLFVPAVRNYRIDTALHQN